MKEWYNIELFKASDIKALRCLLKMMNLEFEISGCYSGAHFEIYCTENDAKEIDKVVSMW